MRAGDEGHGLDPGALEPVRAATWTFAREAGLQLFRYDRTLGSEALSRRSEPMRRMSGVPEALFAPADAARLGLEHSVLLEVDGSAVEVAARTHVSVPEGVVLVPREIEWPIIPRPGAVARAVAMQPEGVTR